MPLRIFPEDDRVLDLLADMAGQVSESTRCCSELLGCEEDRVEEILTEARGLDARTADLYFSAMTTSRSSYVLPIPRSDVYVLSGWLARACDSLLLAAEAMSEPSMRRQSKHTAEQLNTIGRMAGLSQRAMHNLSGLKGLDEYWYDMFRLRKQADRTFERHRLDLLDRHKPTVALQRTIMVEHLHSAATALSQVATEVGRIVVAET
ncbi:hypothetical protein GWK18_08390 [Kocuria sp. JC486]|uniref:Phosphate transport regulator n=1 Tax=Kocuria soli TaxID=2485125 RepID=A0A3N4A2W7_9MICC|nr:MULTISPECIES: hypothetical protein [Kocuria]NHU85605.1 hypothetical protein [Kocuria sp. JC486]ROZ62781.1 hypothetical protein EDL96_08340 [Kocuria soli]